VHVGVVGGEGLVGELADRAFLGGGAGVDLVVDVGDVADVGDVLRPVDVAQQAEQHVEDHDGAGVADVGAVVDGGAADIHANVRGVDRREALLAAAQGVVEGDLGLVLAHARGSRFCRGGLSRWSEVGKRNARRDGGQRQIMQIAMERRVVIGAL
jgi:hypothetical protein